MKETKDRGSAAEQIRWRGARRGALIVSLVATAHLAPPLGAQTVKDREGAVRDDKARMENHQRWRYNDYRAALEEGKRTGKPVMVALRCVPCLACSGFDAQVLLENTELSPLLDQFICVRVINANDLELSKFQFDYDLSFSALFFNGDGTLYGRFGSWAHQEDAQNRATGGLKTALEDVLELHLSYPENRPSLAGKQATPLPFKTPRDIPALSGKYEADLNWNGKVVQSCIHCHQIGDGLRLGYRAAKQPIPESLLFPFPQPEVIGLDLDDSEGLRIEAVKQASAAARAGLRAGDELLQLAGQPLVSVADVAWALHQAPPVGEIHAAVRRGDEADRVSLLISLDAGWREAPDHTKRVGTWPMRGMALGGMKLEELPGPDRVAAGIEYHRMALRAAHVGKYGKHAAARKAGFKEGDVLLAVDGDQSRTTENQLIARLLRTRQAGEEVAVTVLRDGKRLRLMLPMQ